MGSVLTMEQGAILHHHVPLQDYALPAEHDYSDQFPAHSHQPYTTGSAVDQLRRDSSAPLQAPTPFTFTPANGGSGPRFVSERPIASEANHYQGANNFTDSSSGSISTSPSSASSSLAYTNYQQNHCTSLSSFGGPVQLPQAFVTHAPYASRVPPILDNGGPGMLPPPNPIRSPITSSTNAIDREAYANSTPYLARSQLSPGSHTGYGSYSDTPRTALPIAHLSLSNASYANGHQRPMASPSYQHGSSTECHNFPWPNLEIHAEMTCEGQSVTPEVHAKVEKGFFPSTVDQKWTCYRRNYFSVQCSFELHPNINNGRMLLKRNNSNKTEAIQAMGMRLSAAVDGSGGKGIELVQHTPKRDAGPKNKIEVVKVSPLPSTGRSDSTVSPHGIYHVPMSTFHATGQVPGPYLPMQNTSDGNSAVASTQASQLSSSYPYSAASAASHLPLPGQSTAHTFERVQFKQATANNGKRRASQQYFHLIVELFADVREKNEDNPVWVKVAHRVSEKIVVRGRSPSHYQNEGQHGQNGRTSGSGGSGGYGSTAGGGSYSSLSAGGFRMSGSSYSGGVAGSSYRSNAYGYHPSPEHSGSSASSVDGGAQDSDYPGDTVMSEQERNDIHSHDGYRYFPAPIFEGGPPPGLPLPKIENAVRFSTDPSQWAVKYEPNEAAMPGAQWHGASLSRFQGVDSSRGYYPTDPTSNYS